MLFRELFYWLVLAYMLYIAAYTTALELKPEFNCIKLYLKLVVLLKQVALYNSLEWVRA